jgi:antitoxin ParD1/3/4
MNVSLTPELESLVTTKVESGMYNSASEVIREGLRLLQERDEVRRIRIKELKKEVQIGKDALKAGKFTEYDTAEDLINGIRQEGNKRIGQQKKR